MLYAEDHTGMDPEDQNITQHRRNRGIAQFLDLYHTCKESLAFLEEIEEAERKQKLSSTQSPGLTRDPQ